MKNITRSSGNLKVRDRFDTGPAAAKYARSLGGTATHRRELACIHRALRGVPQGATVLDLPCGTGRLIPSLHRAGFAVTGADSSAHMVREAREYLDRHAPEYADVTLEVKDAFSISYGDDAFDSVVCNRLLHHFPEAEDRRLVLRELSRICKGPIVVSFFSSGSWDGVVFRLKDVLRGGVANDRIPIARRALAADAAAAGLRVVEWYATRPRISKQEYAVLERR